MYVDTIDYFADVAEKKAELLTPISQMITPLTDLLSLFCYKNHDVIGGFGVLIWPTRWVNLKRGF